MFRHVADALVTLVILVRYSYCSSRNAERKDSSDFSVPTVSVPCFHMVVTVRARTSFVVAGIRGGTWTSSNLTWQQLCHIASMRAGMVLSILQAWVRCLVASLLMIYIYTCICNGYAYLCYIYVSIIFIYTQLYMSYLFICLFIYVYYIVTCSCAFRVFASKFGTCDAMPNSRVQANCSRRDYWECQSKVLASRACHLMFLLQRFPHCWNCENFSRFGGMLGMFHE